MTAKKARPKDKAPAKKKAKKPARKIPVTAKPKKRGPANKLPKKPPLLKTGANGRPSAYRPEYAEEVFELCIAGYTDKMLAEHFQVSENTVGSWKSKYPEFLGSMRRGKGIANGRAAMGLYNRAVGMTVPDDHVAVYEGRVIVTPLTKHLPPDVQAAKFFLKNRLPEQWREKFGVTDVKGGAFGIHIHEYLRPKGDS
jgi:hypothetical protein